MPKKILLHPDVFYTKHSGAIASREASRQLSKLGYEIAVFTHDNEDKEIVDYNYFKRIPFRGISNYFSSEYKKSLEGVIYKFNPDYMFFIGGIVNVPQVYLDLCIKYNIKTVFLLLVQDFYCVRLHAGLGTSSCSLCLDESNWNAFKNNCAEKQQKQLFWFICTECLPI